MLDNFRRLRIVDRGCVDMPGELVLDEGGGYGKILFRRVALLVPFQIRIRFDYLPGIPRTVFARSMVNVLLDEDRKPW